MMAGAAVSLFDRRLRVGAPARRRQPPPSRERPPHERGAPGGARPRCCCRSRVPARRSPCCPARCCPTRRSRRAPGRCRRELRCMVCQNQSIDDSDADLAHDLRVLVRERLKAGDSDEQVIDYVVSRYGEFVLLKPRFNLRNALLWRRRCCCWWRAASSLCSARGAGGPRRRRCRPTRSRRWRRSCATAELPGRNREHAVLWRRSVVCGLTSEGP